ncbi:hypothetical protein ABT404_45155 [Streptomyces hyaluromycini]|uniref:Secreted protein n=1 Tax=Streptomyces hyaluromycini TaxID=1377993 RepID=A0ABV1XBZ9_9ACTN
MRALPARRLASTALCAALLAGVTGPAAAAADPAHEHTRAASQAPVPGADALLGQTKSLGDLAAVLKPVTDLLAAVLKADNGQLTPDQAAQLADAAKAAIAQLTAAAPAPSLPSTPALPSAPALPAVAAATAAQAKGLGDAPAAKDLAGDALKALQTAIDNLVKAVTSGDAGQVVPAVTAVLTGLVDCLAALLLGGGLPAPDLAGLPTLPSLPATTPLPLPPS